MTCANSFKGEMCVYGSTDSGKCGENLTYILDKENYTLTITGSGDMYPFTGSYSPSNAPWKYDLYYIKTVNISEGVTSIGDEAFKACNNIETVNMPDSIVYIGKGAFQDCDKLKNIKIPEKVKTIRNNTFSGCSSLKELIIPEGVTEFGDCAFQYCNGIKEMSIPCSAYIYRNHTAFENVSNIEKITISISVRN